MSKVLKNVSSMMARMTRKKTEKFAAELATPSEESALAKTESSLKLKAHSSFSNMLKMSFQFKQRLQYRLLLDAQSKKTDSDECADKQKKTHHMKNQRTYFKAYGKLSVMPDRSRDFALFLPVDSRFPRLQIPAEELPNGFFERPQKFDNLLYVALFVEWLPRSTYARGKLLNFLGLIGDIEAESEGILAVHGVDTSRFSQSALDSLPIKNVDEWCVDEKELKYRRDFRDQTIFTIDPKTAKDLDDALHIKKLDDYDGNGSLGWEVGVHIADVAHFLEEGSELDKVAAEKANTYYLVQKVLFIFCNEQPSFLFFWAIPMLPNILCEDLCSLNPGVDRLAFSVVFKLDAEANILDKWFGRSVIKSCTKLSYEDAQEIIDRVGQGCKSENFPKVFGNRCFSDVKAAVIDLFNVSQILRKRRVEDGALMLNTRSLGIVLDKESGGPLGAILEKSGSANNLVEEFMLLANIAVAGRIYEAYPDTALLRCHPEPKETFLKEMVKACRSFPYPIARGERKEISLAMEKYLADPLLKDTAGPVFSLLMLRCLEWAIYFCAGETERKLSFSHYALNVDCYTHFTSPIRRYPDVIVHRMLAASLGYTSPTNYSVKKMQALAKHCSAKKVAQKDVGDDSAVIFFNVLIKKLGSLETLGIVCAINEDDVSFDVMLVKYGVCRRVYTNNMNLVSKGLQADSLIVCAKTPDAVDCEIGQNISEAEAKQTVRMLSVVKAVLSPGVVFSKFEVTIVPTSDDKPLTFNDVVAHLNENGEKETDSRQDISVYN